MAALNLRVLLPGAFANVDIAIERRSARRGIAKKVRRVGALMAANEYRAAVGWDVEFRPRGAMAGALEVDQMSLTRLLAA